MSVKLCRTQEDLARTTRSGHYIQDTPLALHVNELFQVMLPESLVTIINNELFYGIAGGVPAPMLGLQIHRLCYSSLAPDIHWIRNMLPRKSLLQAVAIDPTSSWRQSTSNRQCQSRSISIRHLTCAGTPSHSPSFQSPSTLNESAHVWSSLPNPDCSRHPSRTLLLRPCAAAFIARAMQDQLLKCHTP